ncbi:acyl-CoA dehydrogenase [Risungbinella massiliensis]|uniref:acyl-CoA dehydrogenase n=1 Tax=Risungbinella massiliensis TaxID=1329796 RepID=UPI0009E23CA6|nr:acyl-CoA dehydrogenase [Risungbinella massiliensis]
MQFTWTEEQKLLRDMVRDFAQKEILPEISRMEQEERFPREILTKMGKLGLLGIPIADQWGGAGADFPSYILTLEEISRVSATVGVILAVHTSVGTMPIVRYGTEEQKQKFLPKLTSGEWIGAFGLTEPQAGSDAAQIRTTAVRQGEHYILNGTKIFITNSIEANLYLVFAVTDPRLGSKGISAFLVEKGTPGFSFGSLEKKMGLHGSNTGELIMENAQVPVANLLGKEGQGYEIALSNLAGGRIGIAAQGLGIAQAAFEYALAFSKERKQFGKPIGEQQAIQFKLAEMATKIEAARLLVYSAAEKKQLNAPCKKEASMAKQFATDVAMEVTTEAIQVCGGMGYTKEIPVERYFRDAKVTQIYEGTNEIQRLVIAKELIS